MHSPHTFDIKSTKPQTICNGGSRTIANSDNFPILKGMAMYSLLLKKGGVREPHWHPNAAELDYVVKGRARMTIFSPGGDIDTFEVGPDQIVFIPTAYFHYIENIGDEELHFAFFFSHDKPQDIGISGAFGSYSNEVLGAVFNAILKSLKPNPNIRKIFLLKQAEDNKVISYGNICLRYPRIEVGYLAGGIYCRRCEYYFFTERLFCECCGMRLRASPANRECKEKVRA